MPNPERSARHPSLVACACALISRCHLLSSSPACWRLARAAVPPGPKVSSRPRRLEAWHLTAITPRRRRSAVTAIALLCLPAAPSPPCDPCHPHPAGSKGRDEGVCVLANLTKLSRHYTFHLPQTHPDSPAWPPLSPQLLQAPLTPCLRSAALAFMRYSPWS